MGREGRDAERKLHEADGKWVGMKVDDAWTEWIGLFQFVFLFLIPFFFLSFFFFH